jgi:hypothetical protein
MIDLDFPLYMMIIRNLLSGLKKLKNYDTLTTMEFERERYVSLTQSHPSDQSCAQHNDTYQTFLIFYNK